MKTIYLFRHSTPEKTSSLSNELIPLSEDGKKAIIEFLDKNKMDRKLKVFSSSYQRAYETSKLIGNYVIKDDRLIERKTGLRESFTKEMWLKQYIDCDFCNKDGESFRMVRHRMTEAINEILSLMSDGESVIIVSHAAAICAYLQQFCEITVTDPNRKCRKIEYRKEVILEGAIGTPSFFELIFEDNLSHISYMS